jgi:hypothetical protein
LGFLAKSAENEGRRTASVSWLVAPYWLGASLAKDQESLKKSRKKWRFGRQCGYFSAGDFFACRFPRRTVAGWRPLM